MLDNNNKPIFTNNKFLDFFHIDNVEQFIDKHDCISSLFIHNNDFFYNDTDNYWIDEVKSLNDNKRVVLIMDTNKLEPASFLLNVKSIENTKHFILSFVEITSLTSEKKDFEQKAFTDKLTNIYNRAYFEVEMDKEFSSFKRENRPLSLIILDIDKFKDFNDNYGHQIGDEVLKELAKAISQNIRTTDIFARWGGEEFVIILPATALESAKKVAEHLRVTVEQHSFKDDLNVTCSFGVSECGEDDTKESFLKKVDEALYRAKRNGRNRVEG